MKNLKKFSPYLAAPTLAITLFILLFQVWKIDFSQPIFSYSNDSLVSLFEVKNVIDEGWFFSNSSVGLPHITEKFYLHDFPLQADSFHFLVIKIFSYFSSNPFLILNCFFIFTFILISATSFVALRAFDVSNFSATLISILYAFTPYHFVRNVDHLFLSNYAAIPLVIMAALWIATDKIRVIRPNRFFFITAAISIFVAANGIYYAFYSAVIFIFAWLLRGLEGRKFFDKNGFATPVFGLTIILTLICLYLPSLNYWMHSGFASNVVRDRYQSELFALRIINLFLPVENHYIEYFANVRRFFNSFAVEMESGAESLGILASAGFLFLLLWLIAKSLSDEKNSFLQTTIQKFSLQKNDQTLISKLACLNLLSVLFATVGGLVMFIAVPFPLLRSHARFSIFIAFIALFLIAIFFDKIIEKKFLHKKNYAKILISIVTLFALFDQVGRVSASSIQTEIMQNQFRINRDFVEKIEQNMPQGAAIFQMPIACFPECGSYELLFGYLHSKNLRWSFPAIKNRHAFLWQKEATKLNFQDFISKLKNAGFSGIYIDRIEFAARGKTGWNDLRVFEAKMKMVAKGPMIVSKNSRLVFFKI